jgi:hypothetical protein
VQYQPDTLVLAAAFGTHDDVDLLLQNFGTYSIDMCMNPLGLAAVHVAVIRGNVRMVRVLLDAGVCVACWCTGRGACTSQ